VLEETVILRKIDFNYDHFISAYGPNGDGVGEGARRCQSASAGAANRARCGPAYSFRSAIKAGGTFYGLGSAAFVDSYRSTTGAYDSTVKDNPSDSRYGDSHSGTVEINTAVATILGSIFANVYTMAEVSPRRRASISESSITMSLSTCPISPMPSTTTWNYVASPSAVI